MSQIREEKIEKNEEIADQFIEHLRTLSPEEEENLAARLAYKAAVIKEPVMEFFIRCVMKAKLMGSG